jgi:hypothetical protein
MFAKICSFKQGGVVNERPARKSNTCPGTDYFSASFTTFIFTRNCGPVLEMENVIQLEK